jgi:hypothetical protein
MLKPSVNYLEKAAELKRQAHQLIKELGIMYRWSLVGNTVLVGSASFGLMSTPNLDFEIYVDQPDIRQGFDTVREIATISGVQQIQFHNFMGTSDPGLYWRIDYQDRYGVIWDIDNWLVPFSHPHAGMAASFATAMNQALTDESRQIILTIKAQMSPTKKFRGIDVYKAVLDGGVRDWAEFLQWMEKNPPVKMETWRPSI